MTKIGKLDGEGTFPGTRGNDKVAPKAVTLAVQTSKFTPGASLSLSPGSAGRRTSAGGFSQIAVLDGADWVNCRAMSQIDVFIALDRHRVTRD